MTADKILEGSRADHPARLKNKSIRWSEFHSTALECSVLLPLSAASSSILPFGMSAPTKFLIRSTSLAAACTLTVRRTLNTSLCYRCLVTQLCRQRLASSSPLRFIFIARTCGTLPHFIHNSHPHRTMGSHSQASYACGPAVNTLHSCTCFVSA